MSNSYCPFRIDDRVSWRGRAGTVVYILEFPPESEQSWNVFVHFDDMGNPRLATCFGRDGGHVPASELKREPNEPSRERRTHLVPKTCPICKRNALMCQFDFLDGGIGYVCPQCQHVEQPPALPGEWRDYPDGPGWWIRFLDRTENGFQCGIRFGAAAPEMQAHTTNRWLRLPDGPPKE